MYSLILVKPPQSSLHVADAGDKYEIRVLVLVLVRYGCLQYSYRDAYMRFRVP